MMRGSGATNAAGSAARELLAEVARRWRTHVRRQFVTRLAGGVAVVCLAGWAVDRFVPGAARAIVLVTLATLAVSAVYAGWQIWSRRTVPRRRDLARFVEDHWPSLEDRLVTAVDVLEVPGSVPGALVPRKLATRTGRSPVSPSTPSCRTRFCAARDSGPLPRWRRSPSRALSG